MRECKFKVGDKVIGNKKANRYSYLGEGYIGTITDVYNGSNPLNLPDMIVDGNLVCSECFDLLKSSVDDVKSNAERNSQEFDWKGFKQGKFVVHCKTEELSMEFLRECQKRDISWGWYDKATKFVPFEIYEENTCYIFDNGRLFYGSVKSFEKIKKKIVEFKAEQTSSLDKSDSFKEVHRCAKQGEWVKIVNADTGNNGDYQDGDILKIVKVQHGKPYYQDRFAKFLYPEEYVVLEGYKPDDKVEKQEIEKVDITKVSTEDLLAEIARRINKK